jgi:hypothetical protein
METFEQPFHGIQFAIFDAGYYDTLDRGAPIRSTHIAGDSEVKLQVSLR